MPAQQVSRSPRSADGGQRLEHAARPSPSPRWWFRRGPWRSTTDVHPVPTTRGFPRRTSEETRSPCPRGEPVSGSLGATGLGHLGVRRRVEPEHGGGRCRRVEGREAHLERRLGDVLREHLHAGRDMRLAVDRDAHGVDERAGVAWLEHQLVRRAAGHDRRTVGADPGGRRDRLQGGVGRLLRGHRRAGRQAARCRPSSRSPRRGGWRSCRSWTTTTGRRRCGPGRTPPTSRAAPGGPGWGRRTTGAACATRRPARSCPSCRSHRRRAGSAGRGCCSGRRSRTGPSTRAFWTSTRSCEALRCGSPPRALAVITPDDGAAARQHEGGDDREPSSAGWVGARTRSWTQPCAITL